MAKLERTFNVAAEPDAVFSVISDFERYPLFLSEIREARFDRSEVGPSIARFDLFILLHVRYSIEVELNAPNKISWRLRDSNVLDVNSGSWEIERTDTGSHVRYNVEIELKGAVPPAILDRLTGQHLEQMLDRFRDRILGNHSEDDETRVASS